VGLRPSDVKEFVEISAPNHAPSDDLCPSMDRLLSKIFSTFLHRGLEGRVESGQREFRLEVMAGLAILLKNRQHIIPGEGRSPRSPPLEARGQAADRPKGT